MLQVIFSLVSALSTAIAHQHRERPQPVGSAQLAVALTENRLPPTVLSQLQPIVPAVVQSSRIMKVTNDEIVSALTIWNAAPSVHTRKVLSE